MSEPTRRNFGIRLPVELIDAIEARAKATGQTKTETVEAILRDALGLEVGTDDPDVMQRLANVEQRLTIVERRLTPPPPSPAVATEGTSMGHSSTRAARADGEGQRGLTARQAWEYCLSQGWVSPRGSTTQSAFVQWAGRNPDKLLLQYGLTPTGHSGSSNTTASYRKV